ncbi:MAG: hypothetical protein QN135_06005 [Armatimonadota bacterium]|nr:hypothetical protein [Armatimonadota bacterium]
MPYLLVILAVLVGYYLYTRVLAPPPTGGPPQPPPPVAATPAPPVAEATSTPQPPSGVQAGVELPARAVGRGNPFVPLVVPPQAAAAPRPAAPPPPAVPPPFFPGPPAPGVPTGTGPGLAATPGPPRPPARVAGVLIQDGERMAILDIGGTTYIVKVGDIVEGFRVIEITAQRVVLRQGETRLELELGGGEER